MSGRHAPARRAARAALLLAAAALPAPAAAFETWVGGRDLRNTSNVVRWLAGGGGGRPWADGISVGFPAIYAPGDLAALSAAGVRLLPCIHASLETMQRQLFDDGSGPGGGRAAPDTALFAGAYATELPDFRAGTAGGPGPFMWWSLTEDDSSGVGFPYEQLALPPSTHADAWAQFDAYLQRAQVLALALAPGAPLVAQVGFAEQTHAHLARGARLALVERANDDVGDLATALAFARGAARQFNASFGVDLSWWWGVVYGGVNRMLGSYHRRVAFLAWAAGAAVVNIEGGDGLCDAAGAPLALGAELQAFAAFARREGAGGLAPAAAPVAPVLLVLPKDHGYATRPYWLPQAQGYGYARLPPRLGDRAVGAFFAWAFPGAGFVQDPWPFGAFAVDDPPASMWALSSLTAPYAPRASDVLAAAPYVPFGTYPNRSAAAAAFAASPGVDPAPWRPLSDSTWGHIFDVAVAGLGTAAAGQVPATPNNVFGGAAARGRRAARRRGGGWAGGRGGGGGGRGGGGRGVDRDSGGRGGDGGRYSDSGFDTADPADPTADPTTSADPPLPLGPGSGYRLAVLLGPVSLTPALKAQLAAFAAGGGHVVLAAGVAGPGDGDLTGLPALTPEVRAGRAWRWAAAPTPARAEAFRFVPAPFPAGAPPPGVTVLAATVAPLDVCGGAPCALATRYALGAGAVTTVLVPWAEAGDGLAGVARAVLQDAVDAAAPLALSWADGEGWPVDAAATADVAGGAYTVLVGNNDEAGWRGAVRVGQALPDAPASLSGCRELRSGAPVPLDASGRAFQLAVAGFDVAVVRCNATWA